MSGAFEFVDSNPARDWSPHQAVTPTIDLVQSKIEGLAFESPVEEASKLGRPESYKHLAQDYFRFFYPESGLILEYGHHELMYAAVLLAPSPDDPVSPNLQYAAPVLVTPARRESLSSRSNDLDIVELLGPPLGDDRNDEERILVYRFGTLEAELELNADGKLRRINIFPAEDI